MNDAMLQFELSKLKLKRPKLKWVVGLSIALMIGTGLMALPDLWLKSYERLQNAARSTAETQ